MSPDLVEPSPISKPLDFYLSQLLPHSAFLETHCTTNIWEVLILFKAESFKEKEKKTITSPTSQSPFTSSILQFWDENPTGAGLLPAAFTAVQHGDPSSHPRFCLLASLALQVRYLGQEDAPGLKYGFTKGWGHRLQIWVLAVGVSKGSLGPECKVSAVSSRAQLRIQVEFPGHQFTGIQCVAL